MPEPIRLKSTQSLFAGLIDYAGLFPPAGLTMKTAVRNYATYHQEPFAWMLGRFILPISRLQEFETAAQEWLSITTTVSPWQLSVLGSADIQADLMAITAFNQQYASRAMIAVIDTVEYKTETSEAVRQCLTTMPTDLAVYCEVPTDERLPDLLAALSEHEGRAKIRTGGVTAEAFPSTRDVARFLRVCAEADVPFKATAGLHHPLRAEHRLTYEPDSATATMHGFLNVFLAAGFAQYGLEESALVEILEERDPQAFMFDNGGVSWRDHDLVVAHLRNTRSLFALSFGSCSFAEPIADLQKLGLL